VLVDQVVMPPIGMLLSGVDFAKLAWVLKAGRPGDDGQRGGGDPVRRPDQRRHPVPDRGLGGVPDRQGRERHAPRPAAGRRGPAAPQEALLMEIRDLLKAR
jgi:large conductance mechanosensitive channel